MYALLAPLIRGFSNAALKQVKHIVICGHYDCRLVNVGARVSSVVEWLRWVIPSCSSVFTMM